MEGQDRLKPFQDRGDGGGKDWEFGVSRCKLLDIGWVNNKVLLYSTGKLNSISSDKP